MGSIWPQTALLPSFPPLDQEVHTQVAVVGGGITGLLCAYFLEQAGVDYVLLEAKTLCSGVTGSTTAKLTAQHGLIYHKLLHTHGFHGARLYLEANQAALEQYRNLCQQMDCDFQEQDAYVYSLTDRAPVEREADALQALGFPAQTVSALPLPFPVAGAVQIPQQAQIHHLKFLSHLSKGLRIYEHTKVQQLSPGVVSTPGGRVHAKKIILATHFPILNKHGLYFVKLYQHRSYVLVLQNAPDFPGMYLDQSDQGLSFRHWNGLLLLGGGSHPTGKKGGGWAELSAFAARHYPQAREAARWAAQDCMPLAHMPYIGPYSPATPDLFVATGFQKWGMTSAKVAATVLTDLVQDNPNPYASLFAPNRSILHPQLAANLLRSTVNLLTPTVPRCPHMGCALKYNPQEHTWDCPCHGSRFTEDGQLLDNPAADDLSL